MNEKNSIRVAYFTFNAFQENTYLLYDDTKECIIFDPGCYAPEEEEALMNYIKHEGLKPVRLINTHCHLDHVFGNRFVADQYNLVLEAHEGEIPVLEAALPIAKQYGFSEIKASPEIGKFLKEGDAVTFGESSLEVLFTPGHSPASISLYSAEADLVVAGDVLFLQSIGRTDLPGGDFDTLINSIREKLLPLGDEVHVLPGHGPATTIGFEKENNPFLRGV